RPAAQASCKARHACDRRSKPSVPAMEISRRRRRCELVHARLRKLAAWMTGFARAMDIPRERRLRTEALARAGRPPHGRGPSRPRAGLPRRQTPLPMTNRPHDLT
ncbi:hypothetical protein ACFQ12_04830, partial [Methylobacterium trifolii]